MILDLFAGPGGADEGIRLAGYTGELVGVEKDADACATATAAGHHRVLADVATLDRGQFAGIEGLWGSPPCQSFSSAGKRGGINDERGQLVWQPLEWALELLPRWVVLEQVPEVLPIWQICAAALRAASYHVWTSTVNSADYGVPQTRIRAGLVARRDGVKAGAPEQTHTRHAGDDLFGSQLQPWVTMADALGWAEDVAYRRTRGAGISERHGERHGERPDTPATRPAPTITGKSRSDMWFLGAGAASARTAGALARSTDQPAHTITGKGTAAWVDVKGGHVARVTVEESGVLQGFRPDYPWQGSKSSRHQQAGNAVPPPLAAAMVRPLLASVSSERAA